MRTLAGLVVASVLLAACTTSQTHAPPTTATPDSTWTTTSTTHFSAPEVAPPPGQTDLSCWKSSASGSGERLTFEDATVAASLIDPLTGMYGHAAAWGDPTGDNLPDLIVGTFGDRPDDKYLFRGAGGPSPDRLLTGGLPFTLANEPALALGRTSGAAFADLDGDGDDDLVLSRNAGLKRQSGVPSLVLVNDDGLLTPVRESGLPLDFLGRSVGILDANRDGLLDLLLVEDRYGDTGTRLLLNVGTLHFEDATAAAGIPDGLFGLGVATGDVNGDGWTDFFIGGSNRMFVSSGDTSFHEIASETFVWEVFGNEDDAAGAVFGDLNRDGRPDLVVGQHYNSTVDFGRRVPVRLYLNAGLDAEGDPLFTDATDAAGLDGLPTKAPHVAIEDMDNNGWPDIVTTASAADGSLPAIFLHQGLVDGIPRFALPAGLGDAQYWVAGPVADADRDGRLDIFLVEWFPSLPSKLLRNTSVSGNWLEVSLGIPGRGVGAVVSVYKAGFAGVAAGLVGRREIVVSEGYAAGVLPYAHFGLGDLDRVDVVVQLPSGETITSTSVDANQHLRFPSGC